MQDNQRLCMRCRGRKKLYKTCGAYSFIDTGGVLVTCPMCNGDGVVLKMDDAIKKMKKDLNEKDKLEKSFEIQNTKDKKQKRNKNS